MAFKLVVLCATLAYANAGNLIGGATFAAAPALAYGAAPALAYGAASPVLGSTYHGSYAAPALAAPAAISYAAPTITSQSSNILRSFGNLGQVSTYSKTIDTPFSSVRKADIRVSNPGLRIAAAPAFAAYQGAIAAPAIAIRAGLAAPALAYGHAAVAAPAAIGVAYSAAPAVSHIQYASPYANYGW